VYAAFSYCHAEYHYAECRGAELDNFSSTNSLTALASICNAVVELLPQHQKVKGSSSAAAAYIGIDKLAKSMSRSK